TTSVAFGASGAYVLRLTASDSLLSRTDDVGITVNRPPIVNAGPDIIVVLTSLATLAGSVADDFVTPLTVAWSKVSGPGTITFTNANATTTTASFSVAGDYTVRLTAADGVSTVFDEAIVHVVEPTPPAVVVIASPLDGADVTAPTDVIGSIDKGSWH